MNKKLTLDEITMEKALKQVYEDKGNICTSCKFPISNLGNLDIRTCSCSKE